MFELQAGSNAGDPASHPVTYPTLDSDTDGLSDAWETAKFGNTTAHDGNGNPDGDALTNRQEYLLDLNPNLAVTISTYPDGKGDQDGDNVIDIWELEDGTDPKSAASVDLAKNFVVLQGIMEHKNAWGAVGDPAGQFAGTVMRAQVIGFENAQLSSSNRIYGVLNEVAAPFTSSGSGYTATKSMRFRKGANYQITLTSTSNNLPFISGKYNWVAGGNADEPTYKAFGYVVDGKQGYVPNASGIAGAANTAAMPNVDVNNTHFTLKSGGQGSPDATMYPLGTLSMPALDIIEVASDQIPGNLANKLPHPYYIGEPNNPMLMAGNTGIGTLAVKLTTLPALRSRLHVGIRRVGQAALDSQQIVFNDDTSSAIFVIAGGRPVYEVVGGVDLDNNDTLDPAEAVVVFGKTPFRNKAGGTSGPDSSQQKKVLPYAQHGSAASRDKIIVIGNGEFAAAKESSIGNNVWGTDYAGDLISNFVHGTTTVPTAIVTLDIPISSTQPGLSHPLGAKWNATLQDTTYRFTFADGTEASDDFEESIAVGKIIDQVSKAHLAEMLAIGGSTPMVAPAYSFTSDHNLLVTEEEASFDVINELGNAFGKVTISGFVSLTFTKVNATTILVQDASFAGSFNDLYDFAYGSGGKPRTAAVVQAGHASIAAAPEPNSGKVFFTRLEFNGARVLNKNYP